MIGNPLVWIVVSMAAYALITNAAWAVGLEPRRFEWLSRPGRRLGIRTASPELAMLSRILYFFGIPLLAVALRVGRPSHWGIAWPPTVYSVVLAIVVALVCAALLGFGSAWLDRSARSARKHAFGVPPADALAYMALLALLREAHWAFFRTGTLGVGLNNFTLAVFMSLGLLALEAWSNPWNRAAFDDLKACRDLTTGAGLAVLSALVFLVTGSTPMCLAAHLLVAGTLLSISGHESNRPLSIRRRAATAVDRRRALG